VISPDEAAGAHQGFRAEIGGPAWPPAPEPLPHPVADSHCHLDMSLDADRYGSAPELGEALDVAESVGVNRVVQIGCDVAGARWAVDAANRHDRVVAGVALHPNEAPRLAERGELHAAFRVIEELSADDRVRAIGETGLDYFRTKPEGQAAQEESFRLHIELAKRTGKALVIHDRDAHEDVVRVLLSEGAPERVVFHCFSGGAELARTCTEHGWYMSFAGTVTFKSAEQLRDGLTVAPLDLVLVETDAPFLTPTPYRGRPNASYLIPYTISAMSQVKGVAIDKMCEAIDVNTSTVFGAW
jgi:TatD DNase family protein